LLNGANPGLLDQLVIYGDGQVCHAVTSNMLKQV